jgi:hypothetical protein
MGAAIRAGAVCVQRPDLDSGGGEMMWPADEARRWAVDRLVPSARNARTHSDAQVAQIAAAIREWGWTVPVLVDEDGNLIAGCVFRRNQPALPAQTSHLIRSKPAGHSDDASRGGGTVRGRAD